MSEACHVFGIPIRTTEAIPENVMGVNDGRYMRYFWQGAEVARVDLFTPFTKAEQAAGMVKLIIIPPNKEQ